jgi:hypothetical protein
MEGPDLAQRGKEPFWQVPVRLKKDYLKIICQ